MAARAKSCPAGSYTTEYGDTVRPQKEIPNQF